MLFSKNVLSDKSASQNKFLFGPCSTTFGPYKICKRAKLAHSEQTDLFQPVTKYANLQTWFIGTGRILQAQTTEAKKKRRKGYKKEKKRKRKRKEKKTRHGDRIQYKLDMTPLQFIHPCVHEFWCRIEGNLNRHL